MLSDILRAIDTGEATISKIQYTTCISYQLLKRYLGDLIQLDLITYKIEEKDL